MVKERLIIENFASIKALDIELRSINVLIGKQAVGKSVCIKLIYFFKQFIWQILEVVENHHDQQKLNTAYLSTFMNFFPGYSWERRPFKIRYEMADLYIEISSDENSKIPHLSYSEKYQNEFNHLKLIWKINSHPSDLKEFIEINTVMKRRSLEWLTMQFPMEILHEQIFIPAGRSFFSILQRNIFSLLSSRSEIDPFLTQFGRLYESLKPFHQTEGTLGEEVIPEETQELLSKILQGKYIYRGSEDDILLSEDGRQMRLIDSSSGQKEALPLVVILTYFLRAQNSGHGRTIYIEEPEAHVFPDSQKSIVDLIATVYNLSPERSQFFIATHSPYILTAFNNLIQAGELYRTLASESDLKNLSEIVPKTRSLDFRDIGVYSLEEGFARDIMSEEMGLIDTNIIDEVSNSMAIEFGQLLDLAE
jgi:AAA ATPase domain